MSTHDLTRLASNVSPSTDAGSQANELDALLETAATQIAGSLFRHDPPRSGEIERAIDFIEEELMRPGAPVAPAAHGAALWSTAPALQAWAAVSGPTLTVALVEQWFQRLALAAHGQTGALQGLPPGREAAASLLVLREFMHHRGHAAVTVAAARKTLVAPSPSA